LGINLPQFLETVLDAHNFAIHQSYGQRSHYMRPPAIYNYTLNIPPHAKRKEATGHVIPDVAFENNLACYGYSLKLWEESSPR
jgi:hypothetical protein